MDYLENNTPFSHKKVWEKRDFGFVEHLTSFELEARIGSKKKQHDGTKKKRKGKVLNSNLERENFKVPKHQEDK